MRSSGILFRCVAGALNAFLVSRLRTLLCLLPNMPGWFAGVTDVSKHYAGQFLYGLLVSYNVVAVWNRCGAFAGHPDILHAPAAFFFSASQKSIVNALICPRKDN